MLEENIDGYLHGLNMRKDFLSMILKTEIIKEETAHKNGKVLYGREERRKRSRDGERKKGNR